jgi:hypothetical protein
LGDLGAEIAIVAPVDSDDGQRDMVPDARGGLRREKVAPGVSKNSSTALSSNEGKLVRSIHLRAGHGQFEALAGDAADAALGRGGDDLVAVLAQNGDGLPADQAGAADCAIESR